MFAKICCHPCCTGSDSRAGNSLWHQHQKLRKRDGLLQECSLQQQQQQRCHSVPTLCCPTGMELLLAWQHTPAHDQGAHAATLLLLPCTGWDPATPSPSHPPTGLQRSSPSSGSREVQMWTRCAAAAAAATLVARNPGWSAKHPLLWQAPTCSLRLKAHQYTHRSVLSAPAVHQGHLCRGPAQAGSGQLR